MPTVERKPGVHPGRWGHLEPVGEATEPWSDGPFEGGVQIRSRGSQPELPITERVIPAAGITTSADMDGSAPIKAMPCSGCGEPLGASVVMGSAQQMFGSCCRPGKSLVRATPGRKPRLERRR